LIFKTKFIGLKTKPRKKKLVSSGFLSVYKLGFCLRLLMWVVTDQQYQHVEKSISQLICSKMNRAFFGIL